MIILQFIVSLHKAKMCTKIILIGIHRCIFHFYRQRQFKVKMANSTLDHCGLSLTEIFQCIIITNKF